MVRMCGVIIPQPFITPLLDELFTAIQTFPVSYTSILLNWVLTPQQQSWKVRLKILPLVQGSLAIYMQTLCVTDSVAQSFISVSRS